MSATFQCHGPLNGLTIPDGWAGLCMFDRVSWVMKQGVVADHLDAMYALQDAGEWSDEEASRVPRPVAKDEREIADMKIDELPRRDVYRRKGWAEDYENY